MRKRCAPTRTPINTQKGNMTDTEQGFGVFAGVQTSGTDQSTQII